MPGVHRSMQRLLSVIALVALGGCARAYVQPTPNEPHAVLKFRLVHHDVPGPNLGMELRLGEHVLGRERIAARRGTPLSPSTTAHRVRPELAQIEIRTAFTHQVSRPATRQVSERYACGTQTTGFGTNQRSTTRYCTRNRTEHYQRVDTVVDGACRVGGAFLPQVGQTYIVQYDYYAHERCTAQVFQQLARPDGSFHLVPVAEATPPPS
jgi:hypothetical protein